MEKNIRLVGLLACLFASQIAHSSATLERPERLEYPSSSVVVVDASLAGSKALMAAIDDGARVEVISPDADGLSQISSILRKYNNISELHIVSHGSPGNLLLGSGKLGTKQLVEHASEVSNWGSALADGADVLLYGCNVAMGHGADFVYALGQLLNADVAASTNVTANAKHGGDWQFELTTGPVESEIAFAEKYLDTTTIVLAVPADFTDELVVGSLTHPTDLAQLPSGEMLLLEKRGRMYLADPAAASSVASPYMTIPNVDGAKEKGLLAIALDPDFQNNNYFYVFYHNSAIDRARISRYVHDGVSASSASEFVIWEDNLNTSLQTVANHYGGGMSFGPDGYLYFTYGDKRDFPADAQNLLKTAGKILRLNTNGADSGGPWVQGSANAHLVPTGNPFIDGPGGSPDEIWALGLRNPFRAKWDLPTGRLYIGEVGDNVPEGIDASYEDVHVVTIADAGVNFGYPDCEGPICRGGAEPANYSAPIFSIRQPDARAIVMGPVYRGGQFPAQYSEALFFGDYAEGWLRYLTFDSSGALSDDVPEGGFEFAAPGSVTSVVSIGAGADGALYYLTFGPRFANFNGKGQLRRINFNSVNQAPEVTANGSPTSASTQPLTVSFSGAATDPDGDMLSFLWDFGDGSTSDTPSPVHTYTAKGQYEALLSVSDGVTTTRSDPVIITVGVPPAALIASPVADASFTAGNVIQLRGSGSDLDGTLTNESLLWTVGFNHDDHVHPVISGEVGTPCLPAGSSCFSFEVPDSGHDFTGDTLYEISLEVTDSNGLSDAQTVSIFPQKVDLSFDSDFPGAMTILLNQLPRTLPFEVDSIIGFQHTIEAPATLSANGDSYSFDRWSNGPTNVIQSFATPAGNSSFDARYSNEGPQSFPLSGLVAHFETDAGIKLNGGGVVTGWSDLSGQGNDLSAAGNPLLVDGVLNGQSVIDFDGSGDALLRSAALNGFPQGDQDRTVYMVVSYEGAGSGGFGFGTSSTNQTFGLSINAKGNLRVNAYGPNDRVSSTVGTGAGWIVQSARYASGSLVHSVNGTDIDSAARSYSTSGNLLVLGADLDQSPAVDMQIAALLVYNRALTSAEESSLQQYLTEKYFDDTVPVNQPPIAIPDTAMVGIGGTTVIAVLDNDSDDSALALASVDIVSGPSSGVVEVNSNGTVSYTHNSGASATDAFAYTVLDDEGSVSNQAMVSVSITGNPGSDIPLSGLVARFESDALVAASSAGIVSSWGDQASAGNTLIAGGTPMLVPSDLNGISVIDFDGNDDVLQKLSGVTGLPAGASDRSVFAVVNYRSVGFGGVAWGQSDLNETFGLIVSRFGALEVQGWGVSNDFVSGNAGTDQGWLVQSAIVSGNTVRHFLNATQIDSQTHVYDTVPTSIVVGAEIDGFPFIDMQIAAIFVYDRALSAAEHNQLQFYLAQKYF